MRDIAQYGTLLVKGSGGGCEHTCDKETMETVLNGIWYLDSKLYLN